MTPSVVRNFDPLLKLPVNQNNLDAQQNGTKFKTKIDEMKAFLAVNYFMTIKKLKTIKRFWECGQYVGNKEI